MKKLLILLAAMILAIPFTGCGDEDENTDGNDTDDQCVPDVISGALLDGEPCMQMEDCESGFCNTFSHAPADTEATCEPAPPVGDIHLTATVRDFMTGETMADVDLKLAGALDVLQNPTGFPAAETFTSDADGRVDAVLTGDTAKLGLGLVIVASFNGYFPTTTGLVEPELDCGLYPPGVRNADIKVMPENSLAELSAMLLADYPEEAESLPLGEKGGVVGTAKDVITGDGVPECVLKSQNASSTARIYYLNATGNGFTMDKTSENGLFVLLGASVAERFDAFITDAMVSRRPATCGETQTVLFTTTMQIELP